MKVRGGADEEKQTQTDRVVFKSALRRKCCQRLKGEREDHCSVRGGKGIKRPGKRTKIMGEQR